jgi:hypothetical protein
MVSCTNHCSFCERGSLAMTDAVAGRECHCEERKQPSNPLAD